MTHNFSLFSLCEGVKLPLSAVQWHEALKQGLPCSFLKKLTAQLRLSKKELKSLLLLEDSGDETLSVADSDLLYRFCTVVDILHSKGKSYAEILSYLKTPDPFFKDRTPCELLRNFQGYSYLLNRVKNF